MRRPLSPCWGIPVDFQRLVFVCIVWHLHCGALVAVVSGFSAGLCDVELFGGVDLWSCWIIGDSSWVLLRCMRLWRYVPPSDVATVYDCWSCLSTTNTLHHSFSPGRSGCLHTASPFLRSLRSLTVWSWYHFCLCWRSMSLTRSSAGLLAYGYRIWFSVGSGVFVLRLVKRWAGLHTTLCVGVFL